MFDTFLGIVIGAMGSLVAVLIYVGMFPEKTEKIVGWLLGLFNFGIKKLRQRSIKSSIQGRISSFARSMNEQVNGIMPYNVRLNFVKEIDRTELDPDKQVVIVRIRDNLNDDRNLVHSMMAFCSTGIVPQSRQFLPEAMNTAIDVTMTRKLLNELKHYTALEYLYKEVLSESGDDDIELRDEFCRIFDDLDESGLFTRVVLEEMRDFGTRIATRYPRDWHGNDAVQFVKYVHAVATRHPWEYLQDIGHRSYYISTAFVPVGTSETMTSGCEEPYLIHVRRLKDANYPKAYLIVRGASRSDNSSKSASISMAFQVAKSIRQQGLGAVGRAIEFYAPDNTGNNRKNTLIKIALS